MQIAAAEVEARGEEFLEEVRKWVRAEDGTREQVVEERPVRKWWWRHHTGAWMITLRDGAKELPLGAGKLSIEVGEAENLVQTLETIRAAALAGELEKALEATLQPKKPARKSKP